MAVIFKCKMCGADLDVKEGQTVCTCESCETMQTVPSMDNEEKINMFRRANEARFRCDYEAAANLYNGIAAKFPAEAEAYWGLCLCRYGIEYVEDGGERIPTCHRTSYEKIFDDPDYKKALDNADASARSVYKSEAKEIDRLQSEILKIVENEKPYDIFICYKETADNGGRTEDSVLAQDIYAALTAEGYKVFFSRITLEDKLGTEYEPYIFSALYTSKVMLVVGTKTENINAVWVKNEWSRFLTLMKKDKNKHLYPCYKYISPSELPAEMAMIQGKNIGEIGAVQDLVRNIGKVIPLKKESVQKVYGVTESVDSLLERVFEDHLDSGNWDKAYQTCERILDADPKNAKAFVGKLMADLKLAKVERLADAGKDFEKNDNYRKALRFSDEELKRKLEEYLNSTLYNLGIYSSNTLHKYDIAKQYFSRTKNYKDSEELIQKIDKKIEQLRIEKEKAEEEEAKRRQKIEEDIQKTKRIIAEGADRFKDIYLKYDVSYSGEHAYETQQYIDKYNYMRNKYKKFFPEKRESSDWSILCLCAGIGLALVSVVMIIASFAGINEEASKSVEGVIYVFLGIPLIIAVIVSAIKQKSVAVFFIGMIVANILGGIVAAITIGLHSISPIIGILFTILLAFISFAVNPAPKIKRYNNELEVLERIQQANDQALENALSEEFFSISQKYPELHRAQIEQMQYSALNN